MFLLLRIPILDYCPRLFNKKQKAKKRLKKSYLANYEVMKNVKKKSMIFPFSKEILHPYAVEK